MIPALAFFKALDVKSWIIVGLTVALIGMWGFSQYKSIKIGHLENTISKKEVAIQQYKEDILGLTNAVKTQNAAVDALASKNKEFEATLDEAGAQNAKLSAQAERLISMVKKSHVPPDCKGATDHLNTFTKEFAKEWAE